MATNYTQYTDSVFNNPDLSLWSYLRAILDVMGAVVGQTVMWTFIIGIMYALMYIRQGSAILPSLISLILGSLMFTLLPVDTHAPAKVLLALAIGGLLWHYFMVRR
jgi:membrane protease YdiL (CAAX protease family)